MYDKLDYQMELTLVLKLSWVVICYPAPQIYYHHIHCLEKFLVLLYFLLLFLVVYALVSLKIDKLRLNKDRKGKQ